MGPQTPLPLTRHDDHERFVEEVLAKLPEMVGPARLAGVLDIHRRRIYEMIESGDLAAVRLGPRRLRIFRSSIAEWLRRGGSGPA